MDLNKMKFFILGILYSLVIFVISSMIFFEIYIKHCEPAFIYINSKALCQKYGINKDRCKIKAKYCGEDKGFYRIQINKNGKTKEEYINKNAVDLIIFKDK